MTRWSRQTFTAFGVTQHPPGQHLRQLNPRRVYVTSPGSDNIGEILASMNVAYEPFRGTLDCAILFINCDTCDHVDARALAEFVRSGGCVYASDHADHVVSQAFPGLFRFGGRSGHPGHVTATVVDPELEQIIGSTVGIHFDMGSWTILRHGQADILLRAKGGPYAKLPIMAHAEYGLGSVFYTCFHNRAQATEQEKRLLQLLVLKQFSAVSHTTVEQAGRSLGISLTAMRKHFRD
jgi:hypothetical protein